MILVENFQRFWVRATLARWGRYRSWVLFLGLPTCTAFYRMVAPSKGEPVTDAILEEIDGIVSRAPEDIRRVLMIEYVERGKLKTKAAAINVSTFTYLRRVRRAEAHVESMLGP